VAYEPYSSVQAESGFGGSSALELRQSLMLTWQALKAQRLTWEPVWRDLVDHVLPDAGRFILSDKLRAGQRHDLEIINGTPTRACRVLAAGMMAGITSPARPWFRLITPDPNLSELGPVKLWLAEVEDRIRQALARSNIYKVLSKLYYDLSTFGQCPIFVEEDASDILRGSLYPVGSYCLTTDSAGRVDGLWRECGMTVRQLVQRFGKANLSAATQAKTRSANRQEDWVDLLHVVTARAPGERKGYGGRGMPWKSCWLELNASKTDGLLSEGGFEEFPVMAPRWETTGENVYGTGNPGRLALGDCKQLQLMESRKLQLIEKLADPPMNGPSNMRMERVSFMPGDVNYGTGAQAHQKFEPAYEVNPTALAGLREELRAVQERINGAYYADLWLMFAEAEQGQPITAREVAERHEEKMLQLGPVMENLEDELLDPLIDRSFGILLRSGYLPPAPQELSGGQLRIEYISMMAQAQKMLGTANIERVLGTLGNVAGVDASVLDNFDLDETMRVYADNMGVSPKIIRTKTAVEKIRAMRAKQQQDAQRMQAMAAAAQGAQVLSQADMSGDNALTRIARNAGPIVGAQAGKARP
jgi:Bacteriophage head to tail connecting protein